MKRGIVIALLLLWAARATCGGPSTGSGQADAPPRVRVATFNIENFPKSNRQVAGAFETIRELDAAAVGVQEIVDAGAFRRAARERLGDRWRLVHCQRCPRQQVGVLYDGARLELLSTREYRETVTYPEAKPAFEARLAPRGGGQVLRVIVVHLKSHAEYERTRRRQLRALWPVLEDAVSSGDRVVLLGDFNATGAGDRRAIAALARATGMRWVSEGLECTSYWSRKEECLGTPLDHVLTSVPATAAARGPCEKEGCSPGKACPTFFRDVSDHCPVTVDLR